MPRTRMLHVGWAVGLALLVASRTGAAEDWRQFKYDARHSGNAADRRVTLPLGLVAAVPLTDAVFTAPVVADGRVYVVDGAGVASCIDAETQRVIWRVTTRGGAANCNNVSSPAIAGAYLHFGTTAGSYYVLNARTGDVVKEIRCGGPIFTTPVVGEDRVYFATVGARVFAVAFDGQLAWTWDFVKEVMGFEGDRWNGEDWRRHKNGRVTWRDHFCSSRNLSLFGRTLVMPAGGRTIFLNDAGSRAELKAVGLIPNYAGREYPAAFGQSIGEA